jgi:hypothetical protein
MLVGVQLVHVHWMEKKKTYNASLYAVRVMASEKCLSCKNSHTHGVLVSNQSCRTAHAPDTRAADRQVHTHSALKPIGRAEHCERN